ncbi:MAG: NAD(+)/NADH kinase [Oscillospiraceae bacterium]|nr:NAD(+)/NADH kinase [Oscillospiraceae bacterium]
MITDKIGIIPNEKKDPRLKNTKNLIEFLKGRQANIFLGENYRENFEGAELTLAPEDDLYKICSLLFVLGGDGTMLKAASKASKNDIPLIGINLGRIGFMSEIEADELYLLDNLFSGGYEIKSRMMLEVGIIREGGKIYAGTALNDAVVTHGTQAKLIEIELARDGVKIAKYMADGVIAATPTGSTAYSMSAGGPIIDPEIECFCVTPICPHFPLNRPLIFSKDSQLEITGRNKNSEAYLTIDGQASVKLGENDVVSVKKSKFAARLVSIKKHGFFDVVRAKFSEKF